MRRPLRAILLLIGLLPGHSSADDLTSHPEIIDMFGEVLRRSDFGTRDIESAAFIIRRVDGTFRCLAWPSTGEFRAAHYNGPVPFGVVAIVHTHPITQPIPSPQDRFTAIRLGIPIYAITHRNIFEADTKGRVIPVVRSLPWSSDQMRAPASERLCPHTDTESSLAQRRLPPTELDLMEVCGNRIAIASGHDRECE